MIPAKTIAALGLVLWLAGGCHRQEFVDDECVLMREIGVSPGKQALIRGWIQSTLADPGVLAGTGRESGQLLAMDYELGLDWSLIGIPRNSAVVEFHGQAVDYRRLAAADVEAVIIGHGFGYKLIFKLDPGTAIEASLIEESKKPYGAISMEPLGPDVTLVCQKNRFG